MYIYTVCDTQKCKKKYCKPCMSKYYTDQRLAQLEQMKDSNSWSWECPGCMERCTCRACKRRKSKNILKQNALTDQVQHINPSIVQTQEHQQHNNNHRQYVQTHQAQIPQPAQFYVNGMNLGAAPRNALLQTLLSNPFKK